MTKRKVYAVEFKQDAVQLARSSGNISQTARDLDVGVSLLRKWITADRQAGEQAFPGHGKQHLTSEQQEITRLRKENEILRQEREILKKAAAFLSRAAPMKTLARFFAKKTLR